MEEFILAPSLGFSSWSVGSVDSEPVLKQRVVKAVPLREAGKNSLLSQSPSGTLP